MKKIMRTGIAVGIAAISVQIVNPVYAEESETQNINYTAEVNSDEFVTESDQSSEENQSVEDVQSIDDSKEDENITITYTGEEDSDSNIYTVTKSGWNKEEGVWYYYNTNGERKTGWLYDGNRWYYLDENNNGAMLAGTRKTINNASYWFEASGAMQTGWILKPEGWYYANTSGAVVNGWQLVNKRWYYLNPQKEGLMSTGWIKLGDIWYYLESSGAIKTGWWNNYYFGSDGAMRTGWQLIDNKWYYFYKANDPNITEYKEGLMATNIEIDGWTIGSSGVAVESLEQKIDEIKRYVTTPYLYGGATTKGWDCSGFTQWALKYLGVSIPRSSYDQAKGGMVINVKDKSLWKAGDILLYANSSGSINHVALYLGDGKLMHALNSKYGTLIQGVDYYETWDKGNSLVGVRRYL